MTSPYDRDFKGVQVLQRLLEWLAARSEAERNPDGPMDQPDPAYWDELEAALNAYCLHYTPGSYRSPTRQALEWNGTVYIFKPVGDDGWELQDEIGLTI